MSEPQERAARFRAGLKALRERIGASLEDLKTEADLRDGPSLPTSTSNNLETGKSDSPRWKTVSTYLLACQAFAKKRRMSLPDDTFDLDHWKFQYDKTYKQDTPPKDKHGGTEKDLIRLDSRPVRAASYVTRPELETLSQALHAGRTAVLVPDAVPLSMGVLAGMGGVGKTQIALAYVDSVWDDPALPIIAWIDASSPEKVIRSYARLAVRITGREGGDDKRAALDLVDWLQNTDQKWLLIFDGLTNLEDLRRPDRLWPRDTPNGQIVVTTRYDAPSLWSGESRQLIRVGVFTPEQSDAFLRDRLRDKPALLDGITELAEALGHLPLALAHAAAFMMNRELTAREYVGRFNERKKLVHLVPRLDELSDDYDQTIATTWSISIELADEMSAGVAPTLLSFASLLSPNGIPNTIFFSQAVRDYLGDSLGREVQRDEIHDGLMVLLRLSLAAPGDEEGDGDSRNVIQVHNLVQRATRDDLPAATLARIAWIAADAVAESWSEAEAATDLDRARALRSHIDSLVENSDGCLMTKTAGCHDLLTKVGHGLSRLGLPAEAAAYFRKLVEQATAALGPDDSNTLRLRRHAASALGHTQDSAGAFREFDSLLEDCRRVEGDNHPLTIDTRASRASYLARIGKVKEAVDELEVVLKARRALLGEYAPDTLTTRARLANWRGRLGQIPDAITALEELLVDYERHQPDETRNIQLTKASLATWRGHNGDAAAAAAEYRDLLKELLRTNGPDHPVTIGTRSSLVYWYREAGDRDAMTEAQEELLAERRRILEKYEEAYGSQHPDTLAWRAGLAGARPRRKKWLPAYVAELRALLNDQDRILGPNHPRTLSTRFRLASEIGRSDDPIQAVDELKDILDIAVRVFDPTHYQVFRVLASLAHWQAQAGDRNAAVRTLQFLLRQQMETPGTDDAHIRTTLTNLAERHKEIDNSIGYGEALRALLDHQSENLGADSPEVLATRLKLAVWRVHCGQMEKSVDELRRIAQDSATILGPGDLHTLRTRFELALCLRAAGRHNDAIRSLTALLKDQRHHLDPGHKWIENSVRTLKSWRSESRRQTRKTHPDARWQDPGVRNWDTRDADDQLIAVLRTKGVSSDGLAPLDLNDLLDKTAIRLVQSSRAAPALLQSLALAFDCGVARNDGTWITMANSLSTTVVEEPDIDDLLAEAGAFITTDIDEDATVYRLAHPILARRVLVQAALRSGLDEDLDAMLRHRRIATALIADFTPNRYVIRNLARHAGAGHRLHEIADTPAILDHIDLDTLTEEVLRTTFGTAPLPNEISGVLQVRHLLVGLPAGDRSVVRAIVTPRRRKWSGGLPGLPTPVWTPAWGVHSRDPRHITLVGRPTRSRLRENDDDVLALATAALPDGTNLLAVGHRRTGITLWNTRNGCRVPAEIDSSGDLVALATFAMDSTVLLAVIGQASVRLWDLITRLPIDEPASGFDGGIQAATTFRYGDDRRMLALAEGSGHITLWDPDRRSAVDRSVARHDKPVTAMCSFPSRRRTSECLAIAGESGLVTTWETDPIRLTDLVLDKRKGPITIVAAISTPDATLLWTGGHDGKIAIWDPYTGEQVTKKPVPAHHGSVYTMARVQVSKQETLMATGGSDDTIRLWDPGTARGIGVPLIGHTARIRALATPRLDDEHAALASAGYDASVRMWDLADARTLTTQVRDPHGAVKAMTTARLGWEKELCLVVGHQDGSLQRRSIASGKPIGDAVGSHKSALRILAPVPTSNGTSQVVAVNGDDALTIWDFSSPVPVAELRAPDSGRVNAVVALRQSDGNIVLAIGDSTGTVRLWDIDSDRIVRSIDAHTGQIKSMVAVELDDRTSRLVTGGDDRVIKIWDPDSGKSDGPAIVGASDSVNTLTLLPSPHGPVLASSGDETSGRIRLHDFASRSSMPGIRTQDRSLLINTLACVTTAKGHPLLLGLSRGSALRIWRYDTGEELHRLDIDRRIEAAHVFGSHLALATKRGLYLLELTFDG